MFFYKCINDFIFVLYRKTKVSGWNVSGAVRYDRKGRAVAESMTDFIPGDLSALLGTFPKIGRYYNEYTYDEKDRKIKTVLPDGSVQTEGFFVRDGNNVNESRDPLGRITRRTSDSRGNILEVLKLDNDAAGSVLTRVSYEYNGIGEMVAAYDAENHPITVEYDLLGRKTALCSIDSGRQEFEYDECSNLIRETNSVLRENGKQIYYEYDGLNRLVLVDYPDTVDTEYTYGTSSDRNIHAAGKILSRRDSGGTVSYEYGCLGEVTKEIRTLTAHLNGQSDTETAVMEYRSDYLGRMQYIVYPDGEKIVYGYDDGGQVVSVTGTHFNEEFKYVSDIGYDEYGQRLYIDYGNGVHTDYNYNKERRWLDSIGTKNKWGVVLQNISYSFDRVGNVSGYTNVCTGQFNGSYSTKQSYSYDGLYQLVLAEGETVYNPNKSVNPEFKSYYRQEFTFDASGIGNMISKKSSETVSPNKKIGDDLNYSFKYVYDEKFAHRLVSAENRYYKYDSNGNLIEEQYGAFDEEPTVYGRSVDVDANGIKSTDYGWGLFKDSKSASESERYKRAYTWDERNRLIASSDSTYTVSYLYSQDGERTNKYTLTSETLYFNKMWSCHTDAGNVTEGGQTSKHIYLGETRIVTKLNSGKNPTYSEEFNRQYYYHADHLGSAHLITDHEGSEYQRLEYTPYGEIWVEKTSNIGLQYLPYKFTGKEMDSETGLYYYGARYLDPKYSRWLSTDPALGDYMSGSDAGCGGAYNATNLSLYNYGNNNPLKYVDPTGMWIDNEDGTSTAQKGDTLWDKYGADWKEKSGFDRDPRTLQVGETVGRPNNSTSISITGGSNKSAAKSNNLSTYYFSKNDDYSYYDNNGNLVLVGYSIPNTWETAGDALSAASFFLNCANAGCTLTGQFAVAEGCGTAAMGCDMAATICYVAGGCHDKALAAFIGVGLDVLPYAAYAMKPTLKPAYNMAAHRFINPGTGRFITNACGYRNYLAGPAVGITYSVGSNLYSTYKE